MGSCIPGDLNWPIPSVPHLGPNLRGPILETLSSELIFRYGYFSKVLIGSDHRSNHYWVSKSPKCIKIWALRDNGRWTNWMADKNLWYLSWKLQKIQGMWDFSGISFNLVLKNWTKLNFSFVVLVYAMKFKFHCRKLSNPLQLQSPK